jgi:hypothetical protein
MVESQDRFLKPDFYRNVYPRYSGLPGGVYALSDFFCFNTVYQVELLEHYVAEEYDLEFMDGCASWETTHLDRGEIYRIRRVMRYERSFKPLGRVYPTFLKYKRHLVDTGIGEVSQRDGISKYKFIFGPLILRIARRGGHVELSSFMQQQIFDHLDSTYVGRTPTAKFNKHNHCDHGFFDLLCDTLWYAWRMLCHDTVYGPESVETIGGNNLNFLVRVKSLARSMYDVWESSNRQMRTEGVPRVLVESEVYCMGLADVWFRAPGVDDHMMCGMCLDSLFNDDLYIDKTDIRYYEVMKSQYDTQYDYNQRVYCVTSNGPMWSTRITIGRRKYAFNIPEIFCLTSSSIQKMMTETLVEELGLVNPIIWSDPNGITEHAHCALMSSDHYFMRMIKIICRMVVVVNREYRIAVENQKNRRHMLRINELLSVPCVQIFREGGNKLVWIDDIDGYISGTHELEMSGYLNPSFKLGREFGELSQWLELLKNVPLVHDDLFDDEDQAIDTARILKPFVKCKGGYIGLGEVGQFF